MNAFDSQLASAASYTIFEMLQIVVALTTQDSPYSLYLYNSEQPSEPSLKAPTRHISKQSVAGHLSFMKISGHVALNLFSNALELAERGTCLHTEFEDQQFKNIDRSVKLFERMMYQTQTRMLPGDKQQYFNLCLFYTSTIEFHSISRVHQFTQTLQNGRVDVVAGAGVTVVLAERDNPHIALGFGSPTSTGETADFAMVGKWSFALGQPHRIFVLELNAFCLLVQNVMTFALAEPQAR